MCQCIIFYCQLILESNKVSGLNAPLVQLTFHTESEALTTELTKPALDKMISVIHSAIEFLSTRTSTE